VGDRALSRARRNTRVDQEMTAATIHYGGRTVTLFASRAFPSVTAVGDGACVRISVFLNGDAFDKIGGVCLGWWRQPLWRRGERHLSDVVETFVRGDRSLRVVGSTYWRALRLA